MANHAKPSGNPEGVELWQPESEHPDTIGLRSLGFWLYMMSDAMIFAGLFAANGVYLAAYGTSSITADQVIHPVEGLFPTLFLLSSVFMLGLAFVAIKHGRRGETLRWMGLSLALGAVFILEEMYEFSGLARDGALPQASAFLSNLWTIVWIHGAHVIVGLIWMAAMMVQVARDGFTEPVVGRLINLRLFWFFQALVWVAVYTFVYLIGVS
ncbi:cytochrome c oxidase subunit 3 [Salinisphaera sp. LB1]|uniref:cytochrome c oxidase subunit 3 n=1 Tax=Salinisphaera sp. LB1 TaxID=2183911 RepID=UPI000D708220|nr:cytochrome c oxidase subunit 3 [Salinisphaera sp. LB1]AWN14808.1 Cytochrome O ubiquinol oxidase subunit III [Salinisphaera sp. LB1]